MGKGGNDLWVARRKQTDSSKLLSGTHLFFLMFHVEYPSVAPDGADKVVGLMANIP